MKLHAGQRRGRPRITVSVVAPPNGLRPAPAPREARPCSGTATSPPATRTSGSASLHVEAERAAPRQRRRQLPHVRPGRSAATRPCSTTSTTRSNRKAAPERKLRPRADGAVHARHRQLHRAGREGRPPAPSPAGPTTGTTSSSASSGCTTTAPRRSWATPATSTAMTSSTSSCQQAGRRPVHRRQAVPLLRLRRPGSRRWWPPRRRALQDEQVRDCGRCWRTILTSKAFYSPKSHRRADQEPDPADAGHDPCRIGSGDAVRQRGLLLRRCDTMGQVPFQPPNVRGWPGGRMWINTSTLLARYNTATKPAGRARLVPDRRRPPRRRRRQRLEPTRPRSWTTGSRASIQRPVARGQTTIVDRLASPSTAGLRRREDDVRQDAPVDRCHAGVPTLLSRGYLLLVAGYLWHTSFE